MPCLALVALALPAAAAPDEELLGKSRRLSDRHPRHLVLRRERAGRIVQQPRQAAAALHAASSGIAAAAAAAASPPTIEYRFENRTFTLDDFLAHQRVTGLLLIKDGEVLFERYQYDRNADASLRFALDGEIDRQPRGRDGAGRRKDRLAGRYRSPNTCRSLPAFPMARPRYATCCGCRPASRSRKSMTATTTSPGSRGFGSGKARSRHCASSGIARPEQGTRFHYASSETVILAVLLHAVTGTTLSEYLTARLWQPMGAEADATWVKTPGRHRNRVGQLQCDLARLRPARHAAGQ